jgi:hypothetical protein
MKPTPPPPKPSAVAAPKLFLLAGSSGVSQWCVHYYPTQLALRCGIAAQRVYSSGGPGVRASGTNAGAPASSLGRILINVSLVLRNASLVLRNASLVLRNVSLQAASGQRFLLLGSPLASCLPVIHCGPSYTWHADTQWISL